MDHMLKKIERTCMSHRDPCPFYSSNSMEFRPSIGCKGLKIILKDEILVWEEIEVGYTWAVNGLM